MGMASSLTFTITESGAEPYMLDLITSDDHSLQMLPTSTIEPQKLEDILIAVVAMGNEQGGGKKVKKAKKGNLSRKQTSCNLQLTNSALSSGPPSPPESGSTTPRLTIAPCPERLTPFIPPPNYGAVECGQIFRSSFPQERHMDFVKELGVRSMLYA